MILSDGELLGMIERGECFTKYFVCDPKSGTSLIHFERQQEEAMDWAYNSRRYAELSKQLSEAAKQIFGIKEEIANPYVRFANEFRKDQEKFMTTSDYRRGVEDATKPIPVQYVVDSFVNKFLDDRKKGLLTKKVTKWVSIYQNISTKEIETGYKSLYDSKEEAASFNKYTGVGFISLGTYPIEIEIPV